LQHGNNANANSRMVVFAAYLLRSFGVDVLIPSLRSHGLSQPGFDKVTWSYEYVFDTLGAWDYAVKDPDGVLGGSRPPSKVGLMGFSMGAYLVSSALGIDANVPAVWADGGVWTVNGMAKLTVAPYLGPLAVVVAPIMTWFAKLWAGVDITKNSPPETLPLGPDTRRKVAVVTSTLDSFVPPEETFRFSDFVESNPAKYELVLKLAMPTICNGNAHCSVEFVHPIQYREQLFLFWDKVFNLGAESGLSISSLPSLTRRLHSGEETNLYIEPASVFV
jgi:pimeloyl-ACP methyl ester carboxylesterase